MRARSVVLAALLSCGCGARTAIPELPARTLDATVVAVDAAVTPDAGLDAATMPIDAAIPIDATVPIDAAIPIDAALPIDAARPIDAPDVGRDAGPIAPPIPCPGGLGSEAYVWGEDGVLSRFDAVTFTTTPVGPVNCEGRTDVWTFSISRTGIAYMMFENWQIYALDLATLACSRTSFVPQLGVGSAMGIAVSRDAAAERLFVYGMSQADAAGPSRPLLAVSDLSSFVLTPMMNVVTDPVVSLADMQADAQGHIDLLSADGYFLQLDARDGTVIHIVGTTFRANGGWAILPYNDRVFFFGSPDGTVWELEPVRGGLTVVGNVGFSVVGASAAACLHH